MHGDYMYIEVMFVGPPQSGVQTYKTFPLCSLSHYDPIKAILYKFLQEFACTLWYISHYKPTYRCIHTFLFRKEVFRLYG